MEQKGKSWLEVSLQYGATSRNVGLSILFISEFEERGVRKVTTGITGLGRLFRGIQNIEERQTRLCKSWAGGREALAAPDSNRAFSQPLCNGSFGQLT